MRRLPPLSYRLDENSLPFLQFCRREVVGHVSGGGGAAPPPWSPDDPEYYNDLPGKVPPDVGPPPVPPLPNYQAPLGGGPVVAPVSTGTGGAVGSLKKSSTNQHQANDRARHTVDLSDNLIDLNADVSSMVRLESVAVGSVTTGSNGGGISSSVGGGAAAAALSPFPDHEYVNGIMGSSSDFKNAPVSKDPFDMRKSCLFFFSFSFSMSSGRIQFRQRKKPWQIETKCLGFLQIDPFSAALPSPLPSALLAPNAATLGTAGRPVVTLQRGGTKAGKVRVSPLEAQLLQEIWFHGPISRKEAEDLLKQVKTTKYEKGIFSKKFYDDLFILSVIRMEISWFANHKALKASTCWRECNPDTTSICCWLIPKAL